MSSRGGKMLNRGGGKYFRPPPSDSESSSDEEDEVDDEDDEEDEEDQQQPEEEDEPTTTTMEKKSQPSRTDTLSSSDDDDDDDDDDKGDDEDDDDENDVTRAEPRKRQRAESQSSDDESITANNKSNKSNNKKNKLDKTDASSSRFFDEYAEASDDDDDEPYGTHHDPDDRVKKHYTEADKKRENMDEEARAIMAQQDRRRQNMSKFTRDDDGADVVAQIERRHQMNHRRVDLRRTEEMEVVRDEIAGEDGSVIRDISAVTQQSLLPSVTDPNLWMFSCSNGKEEDLVYQIMNKCIAFARQGKPLGITAVVAGQSRGKIYVESDSEPNVREAVQGVRGLLAYTMKLVPISDMTTVLNVSSKKQPVKKGEWVRMSRGHYKNDLALVRHVRESGLKCIVQTVPRLDFTLSSLTPEEARIRRRTVRPPQKFFSPQEAAAANSNMVTRQRFPGLMVMCDVWENSFYHEGYFWKEVTVGTMVKPCGEDDPPTLDELQQFRRKRRTDENLDDEDEDNEDNFSSKMAKSLLEQLSDLQEGTKLRNDSNKSSAGLYVGDEIEVIEGDLVGMRGKLISMDESTVKVKPINTSDVNLDGMTSVEFLISQVRKYIRIGAHVKVTGGRWMNETGVVVALADEEEEEETGGGENKNDRNVTILTDITNKERIVRMSQLQESTEVAAGLETLGGFELHDLVVLIGGTSTNEVGVIVRVGQEDFTVVNNHGIAREVRPEELRGKRNTSSSRAVALDAQGNQIRVGDSVSVVEPPHKGKVATIKRISRTQLFLYSQMRMENAGIFVVRSRSCVLSGAGSQNRVNGGNSDAFGAQQSRGGGGPGGAANKSKDGLYGKSVRIQGGNWKGHIGTICDSTPTHVQVELHTRLKKVMVVRDRVAVVGDKFGATEDTERLNNMEAGGLMTAATTPFIVGGGVTPMHGGATPMHGGATPMHDGMGGGFTPSHTSETDDVWRPGGNIDRTADETNNDDTSAGDGPSGWGSSTATNNYMESSNSTAQQNETFNSAGGEADTGGGWGSTTNNDQGGGGTWTTSTSNDNTDKKKSMEPPTSSTTETTPKQISDTTTISGASAVGAEDNEEAPVWFMERVCVQLKKNNALATIKEVTNNNAVVEIIEENNESNSSKEQITVSHKDVTMVSPKERDTVLVTGGEDVGVEAELACIDGTDAILKDSTDEFTIVDIRHLAKIIGDG